MTYFLKDPENGWAKGNKEDDVLKNKDPMDPTRNFILF